jgi:GNAT superfamily N-acetyltransferase
MRHASIDIQPLSTARLPDFLRYFEGAAFADNPKWQSCYCQFPHVNHQQVHLPARTAAENRAAACDRIGTGRMQGYLAYRDGAVVGCCNAAPRALLDSFADEPDPDAAHLGHITCFVVAPAHRRSGVATALLAAACEGLRAQGLKIAEASPNTHAEGDAAHHYGPASLYLAAGFVFHREGEHGCTLLRKSLHG